MMRPANLLPSDLAREGAHRLGLPAPAIAAVGAGLAVAGALTFMYMGAHKTVVDRQTELDALQAQIAAVPQPKPVRQSTIDPALGAEKDARQAALDSALSGRVAWDTILRELSLVLPSDVWLQTLSAKGSAAGTVDANGAPTSSTGLTLTGYTYSQAGVARLLSRLALVPKLSNVQLQTSSSATVDTRQVVSFSIAATVDTSTGGGS
jgi:Tfp pilus assembly protein PilN